MIIEEDGTPVVAAAAASDLIIDSDMANFVTDVIDVSKTVPVIVDFWAPWCEPCKQLTPSLEKLVTLGGGIVRLVKINVDENQQLAAQLKVQSVPTVFGFKHGQPIDGFAGAQPESQIKAFIDRLTSGAQSPLDAALEQAAAALDGDDPTTASTLYAQVLTQDPANGKALGGVIRCYLAIGEQAEAQALIDGLEAAMKKHPDVAAAITAFELAQQGEGADQVDLSALHDKLDANENDHQTRFDLALALYGSDQAEQALDQLLDIIKRDRAWNDEAARKQLVKIFEALGPMDPLTVAARRQLSSLLFS
ncbi:MAG TPA: co-chaperone YbbN [Rhodospirillales bacterium]|nr:co-chaperone YbbN [Rhodospirillales bacterium]